MRQKIKKVVGMATYADRKTYVKYAVESLKHQVDFIHVYDNEVEPIDLTDNGKFYFLQLYKEPVYYFSCDDDIIYPPTYINDMIRAIEKYNAIVTHHGRELLGVDLNYYKGHKGYACKKENKECKYIDVAGTGVTAFRTDYFNPVDIWQSSYKKMSDLVFSLEAAKQKKEIILLPHQANYFKPMAIPSSMTISYERAFSKQQEEIALANEIYLLNYELTA